MKRSDYFTGIVLHAYRDQVAHFYPYNISEVSRLIGVHIARVESTLGSELSVPEAENIVSFVVYILLSETSLVKHQQYCNIAFEVVTNYREKTISDLGGQQTPRISAKDNVQTKGSESKPTIGTRVESVKNSKQVKSAFNALNRLLNSLISRGDS